MSRVQKCNPSRYLYKMEKTRLANAPCPIARTLGLVGEWWSLLIIREAFLGVTRFDEFQRNLGISRNALTERLKTLVQGGVLIREPVSEGGRREAYVLTAKGSDLLAVVVAMLQWGDRWLFQGEGCQLRMVEAGTGHELETLQVRSRSGRKLTRADIRMAAALPETDAVRPPTPIPP